MSNTNQGQGVALSTKLVACIIVIACLVVGTIGLILPIIPGLLFLAVAAIIVAKLSPPFERWLRRNTTASEYLDRLERFSDLSVSEKVQLSVLLFAKALIDTLAAAITGIRRLLSPTRSAH